MSVVYCIGLVHTCQWTVKNCEAYRQLELDIGIMLQFR